VVHDVVEQKLAYNVLLYFGRDRVKIVPALVDDCQSVVVPEVAEVTLDLDAQLRTDVTVAAVRLVLDILDQFEPAVQCILDVVKPACRPHAKDDVYEVVH
jgi:hypothetical protein